MAGTPLFAAGLGLAIALASGCERAAEPLLCGDLGTGELVISEVRGGTQVTDADGQWIELYNASGASIDLNGLGLRLKNIDGQYDHEVFMREAYSVAAGEYAVIGKFANEDRPAHVDVGWGLTPVIQNKGTITLSCAGVVVDAIAYGADDAHALPDPTQHPDTMPPSQPPPPRRGTYALGLVPPDAAGNNDVESWCTDGTETLGPCGGGTCLEYYLGSPGEPNPACPP